MKSLSTRAVRIAALLAFACAASTGTLAASGARPQQSSPSAHASTSSAKKKKSHRHHSSARQSFQKAPTPQRISEIQASLGRGGYYQGQPNGKWDSSTVSALQKFQSDNGMNPSGKLDAPSLQKLGLGSSTAGVDAPKPLSHTSPAAASTTSTSATAAPPVASSDPARATASNVSATTSGPTAANSPSATAKPPQH
ncbi:MAG: peptidoglycan-binding domain-containing protein [Candidatus Acidiferrales bacterium]